MKDFVITRKKKHTKEKNVSSNGEGVREKYLVIMVERVGSERKRRKKRKRIGGIGRKVRREWGYLVPVLPVLDCLLDLVPYTYCTWPTAKILCAVLYVKTSMKSSIQSLPLPLHEVQKDCFCLDFLESFLYRGTHPGPCLMHALWANKLAYHLGR